jgi:hypothetical protein
MGTQDFETRACCALRNNILEFGARYKWKLVNSDSRHMIRIFQFQWELMG